MLVLSGGDVGVGGAQGTLMSRNQGWRGPGLDTILPIAPIFLKLGWVDAAGSTWGRNGLPC